MPSRWDTHPCTLAFKDGCVFTTNYKCAPIVRVLHSQWASRKVSTSPVATEAPSSRAVIRPFLSRWRTTLTMCSFFRYSSSSSFSLSTDTHQQQTWAQKCRECVWLTSHKKKKKSVECSMKRHHLFGNTAIVSLTFFPAWMSSLLMPS